MVLKKDQAKNSKKQTILISHFQESLNTDVFFICKVHYLKFKKTGWIAKRTNLYAVQQTANSGSF